MEKKKASTTEKVKVEKNSSEVTSELERSEVPGCEASS